MTTVNLTRRSDIYPAPTLDANGFPVGWVPTSSVEEEWGRWQIVVDGVDVTFFRDKYTQLGTMTWNEPFGDSTVDLIFGMIGPFEPPGTGSLSWLRNGVDVDIYHVRPDGTADHDNPIFEGRALVREVNVGDSTGFSRVVHCLGAIYAADLLIKPPGFAITDDPNQPALDVGTLIATELNSRSTAGTVHLGVCAEVATGVLLASKGSGTQLINGYVQDLLGQAAVAPLPGLGFAVVGIASRPDGGGYWVAAEDGTVIAFEGRTFYGGSMVGRPLNNAVSGMATTPTGFGYWLCAEDGGVFSFGDALFHGEEATPTSAVIGMAATPTGLGYWLVDDLGAVYGFGDASYHGGGAGTTAIVDIEGTPTGLGYWLVDDTGHVYAYGDASYEGGGAGATAIVEMAATATGLGYWLVDDSGHVYAYGDAVFAGNTPDPINAPASGIIAAPGGGYWVVAEDGGVFSFGSAVFHGSVPGNSGEWQGWTLMKRPGRIPDVRLKNRWQVHATVRVGQPGVAMNLHVDQTTSPSVIYGEGTDAAGHTWRNSKYPNLRPVAPPVWPGVVLKLGTVHASVATWTQAMRDAGWKINVGTSFDGQAQDTARAFQAANGLEVTGRVGAQTWAATFVTGANSGDLTGAYVAPVAELPTVEPFLFDAFGAQVGANPMFDRSVLRVERWESFGEHVDRVAAGISARAELARDSTPAVVGTVTLTADVNEMSRYDLRAGMNLLLQGYEGRDVMLHIAQAQIAWDTKGRAVTLTVDEHARDLITVHAIRTRNRSTTDPVRRVSQNHRASRIIPDTAAPWDIPAGAGIIPYFILEGGLWSVIRIPVAEQGTVGDTHIVTAAPTSSFAAAIFSGPITPADLSAVVPDPLAFDTSAGGWSDQFTQRGLLIAWGQDGQSAGYSPGAEDAGGSVTGLLRDAATWDFTSLVPPWLWVALWAPVTCAVSGNLYPSLTPPPT